MNIIETNPASPSAVYCEGEGTAPLTATQRLYTQPGGFLKPQPYDAAICPICAATHRVEGGALARHGRPNPLEPAVAARLARIRAIQAFIRGEGAYPD